MQDSRVGSAREGRKIINVIFTRHSVIQYLNITIKPQDIRFSEFPFFGTDRSSTGRCSVQGKFDEKTRSSHEKLHRELQSNSLV